VMRWPLDLSTLDGAVDNERDVHVAWVGLASERPPGLKADSATLSYSRTSVHLLGFLWVNSSRVER
jgi:hypothetical protein